MLTHALTAQEQEARETALRVAPSHSIPATLQAKEFFHLVPHSRHWDKFWPSLSVSVLIFGATDEKLPLPVWGCRHTLWVAKNASGEEVFSFATFDAGNGWESIDTCSDWNAMMRLCAPGEYD